MPTPQATLDFIDMSDSPSNDTIANDAAKEYRERIEWDSRYKAYWPKLAESSLGGFVVGALLFTYAHLPILGTAGLLGVWDDFKKAAASPESAILVPALLGFLLSLAFTGHKWVDRCARWIVRPAMKFCADFCVTAAGAAVPLTAQIWLSNPFQGLAAAACLYFLAGAAGAAFYYGVWVSEGMTKHYVLEWEGFIRILARGALVVMGCWGI
jgi:hypothetical protein